MMSRTCDEDKVAATLMPRKHLTTTNRTSKFSIHSSDPELRSWTQEVLTEIQTSNPTFPANKVLKILLDKCGRSPELEGQPSDKKRTLEEEGPQRLSKRFRCNKNEDSSQLTEVKTRTSRLSRTHKLKLQRSENISTRTSHVTPGSSKAPEDVPEAPEDDLWTEKFSPVCSSEVMGNEAAVSKMNSWLKKWKLWTECREKKGGEKKESSPGLWDSGDFQGEAGSDPTEKLHNVMLVTGPAGVGKTASVLACALEQGFKVFEVNSSSRRSGRDVMSRLTEATQSHLVESERLKPSFFSNYSNTSCSEIISAKTIKSRTCRRPAKSSRSTGRGTSRAPGVALTNYFQSKAKADHLFFGRDETDEHEDETPEESETKKTKKKKKKATSLILFEEVDVVFEDDVGFYAAIQTFMATTKRPIVLTCNDPSFKDRFSSNLEEILFKTPSTAHTCSFLQLVCLTQKVRLDLDDAISLVTLTHGDLRRCLLQLQLWVKGLDVTRADVRGSSCSASMLGLGLVTRDLLVEALESWSESLVDQMVALLAESWRRHVPLLYCNLDLLLPGNVCQDEVKKLKLSSRTKPPRTSDSLVAAISGFLELMSGLDAAGPRTRAEDLVWTSRSEDLVWTGRERPDEVTWKRLNLLLDIKATAEGLSFHGCWTRATRVAQKSGQNRSDEWSQDQNLSFSFGPQRSVGSEGSSTFDVLVRTLGIMGSRRSSRVDLASFLRLISRRSERPSYLNYLRSLGLPKSHIALLAKDLLR